MPTRSIDCSAFELPVLQASDDEAAAHEALLAEHRQGQQAARPCGGCAAAA